MAANLHQSSVLCLFDVLPVPLMTFAVNGAVTYANRASRQHPGKPVESMQGQPVVKSLLRDITLGKIKMPYEADLELAGGSRLKGQFMAGPSGLDIAFLGRPEADNDGGAGKRMTLADIIALLRQEIDPGIRKLSGALGDLPPNAVMDSLATTSQELHQRLRRLADLIAVFGEDVLITNNRIELAQLIQQVCEELGPRAMALKVQFEVSEPAQALPPLYGCERLLRRALYECLDNAVTHSRREINRQQLMGVKISYLLTGEHVLVTVRNQGSLPEEARGIETREPFSAMARSDADSKTGRLGLPLVQRIVELHGGKVRIASVEDDEVKVMMEFPTGAPQRANTNLDVAQAQRYAKDLAQLMSRRNKEKA